MQHVICTLIAGLAFVMLSSYTPVAAQAPQFEAMTLPGTGDSQDLLRAIAKRYTGQYPDRQVRVPDSVGSGGGIKAVGVGAAPIGRVARLPHPEETAKYGDFRYAEFARVPVAFVVSPNAGVSNVSAQQICQIYAGHLTNWKQVGGHDAPIAVQARPNPGSNMQTIRKHLACFSQLEVTSKAHFNLRNAVLVNSMQTVAGSIGFMPLSEAELHGFHTVSLDGVPPNSPHYKLGIGLGFVYKQPFSPSIQAFLNYLKTEPALDIIRQTGHVPSG